MSRKPLPTNNIYFWSRHRAIDGCSRSSDRTPEVEAPVASRFGAGRIHWPAIGIGLVLGAMLVFVQLGTASLIEAGSYVKSLSWSASSRPEGSQSYWGRFPAFQKARKTTKELEAEGLLDPAPPTPRRPVMKKTTPKQQAPIKAPVTHRAAPTPARSSGDFWLHVSSFKSIENADEEAARLEGFGFQARHLAAFVKGKRWHRVYIGPFPDRRLALAAGSDLSAKGAIDYYQAYRFNDKTAKAAASAPPDKARPRDKADENPEPPVKAPKNTTQNTSGNTPGNTTFLAAEPLPNEKPASAAKPMKKVVPVQTTGKATGSISGAKPQNLKASGLQARSEPTDAETGGSFHPHLNQGLTRGLVRIAAIEKEQAGGFTRFNIKKIPVEEETPGRETESTSGTITAPSKKPVIPKGSINAEFRPEPVDQALPEQSRTQGRIDPRDDSPNRVEENLEGSTVLKTPVKLNRDADMEVVHSDAGQPSNKVTIKIDRPRPEKLQPIGSIVRLSGLVRLADTRQGSDRPIESGSPLYPGDRLITSSEAGLVLRLADHSEINLAGDTDLTLSEFTLDRADKVRTAHFILSRGKIRGSVLEMIGYRSNQFNIVADPTTVGIVGADFLIDGDNEDWVQVAALRKSISVHIKDRPGKVVFIQGGTVTRFIPGKSPGPPRKLTPDILTTLEEGLPPVGSGRSAEKPSGTTTVETGAIAMTTTTLISDWYAPEVGKPDDD